MRLRFPLVAAAILVVVAATALTWGAVLALESDITAQRLAAARLETRIAALEGAQVGEPDWPAIAAAAETSVVTVEAGDSGGSGWVAHSGPAGSDIVTNFHVVSGAWTAGDAAVHVRMQDRTIDGTIVQVDLNDDLAVVHVSEHVPALTAARARPRVGASVMAIGSPLGLDGTVTLGVVSGFRSLEGSDYVQFSAPISPGNSGGPVIDAHGHVVAVASAKLVGTGIEALALAIPVQVACQSLVSCSVSRS